jgi:adenylyltransferase/sulfurtransferase
MNKERYSRHTEIIGAEGQKMLSCSKVLVIGTGGIGSPAIFSLAAVGVGTIGIVDDDTVEISNLNRQILHSEKFLNRPKTDSAKETISNFNSDIEIIPYKQRFDKALAEDIVPDYDVLVDCVDNYVTRKIASHYVVHYQKSLIEAGIEGMSGFVQIVIPGQTACFNCFSLEEKDIYRQVLGASTGVIGCLQALECIKVLTGLWKKDYSYISLNFKNYALDRIFLEPNESCVCNTEKDV